MTNGGYSLSRTGGSLASPVTTYLAGTTYPIVVTQQMVQNSNTPTKILVDGFTLDPSTTTNQYTCKSSWPLKVEFASITDCRTYTIKVDNADVTSLGGCSATSPTYISGLTFNLNAVYSGGVKQNYVEYPNFNALVSNLITSGNVGKTYKLKITISNTGPIYCPASIIYRCITIAGPIASGNLQWVDKSTPSMPVYMPPVTIIGSAPTLGWITATVNASVNSTSAITQYKVQLEASKTIGGPFINLFPNSPYTTIITTATSGGIPDLDINSLPTPYNSAFDGYTGRVQSNFNTWPLVWGVNHGFIYYKISITVENVCSLPPPAPQPTQFTYFKLNISSPMTKADEDYVALSNSKLESIISEQSLNKFDNPIIKMSKLGIESYPNPFSNQISFSGLDEALEILVYNLNQKLINKVLPKENIHTFNTIDWIIGTYIYKIYFRDGSYKTGRIIKIK